MKFSRILSLTACAMSLSACNIAPKPIDHYVEIKPNETAFLIALDGNTKNNQGQLNSIEYLEKNKVSVKRIVIPQLVVNTCPTGFWSCYQVLDAAKLITVSRAPITREWTSNGVTGTSNRDQAFHVQSSENIGFRIGATITAHLDESETAKFLYRYTGEQLDYVLDTNVRTFIGSALAHEFGSRSVDEGIAKKNEIFTGVLALARDNFSKLGITIDNFGFSEGPVFDDAKIQAAINNKFEAAMQNQSADSQLAAAEKFAKAQGAISAQQELGYQQKLVEAQVAMMQKWDGRAPQVVTNDSMFGAMFSAKLPQVGGK